MKVLWLSPSDMLTEPVHGSLDSLGAHEVRICWYDRIGVPVDQGMLDAVDQFSPDLVLYTGQNGGPFLASTDTFERIRRVCPTAFLLHDGTDLTWRALVAEYRQRDVFAVTVNIDGNDDWEKGPRDFTALTPIDPRFYRDQRPLSERPIRFGFAGGYASESRRRIVEYLVSHAGLVVPRRSEVYGSYQAYANFMMSCQIVLNVPFSGSDNAMQVKGRVLEAGWAGCCLLEHEASAARNWLLPGEDYEPYASAADAASKLHYLLEFPRIMADFGERIQVRIRATHSPQFFWNRVFERAFS